ncbi:MAG: hypothetical protein HQK79_20270, partial [Desulfobacterales bacterium]|nr:hypothetical protein [Desulfobacterales bacterium]
HWNYGTGQPGGTIGLQLSSGNILYGPFEVTTEPGWYGTVPNAFWVVDKSSDPLLLPAGTYTIFDSDTESWSQNEGSGGRGMCEVWGVIIQ